MRYRSIAVFFVSMAMVASGAAPFRAAAQTYSGWDGMSQEEISSWRRTNDRLRRAIERLPEDPVVNLPMPILFGVAPSDLSSNFGDPRSGGRKHEGEDIMAPRGAPIVSPTDAVVIGMGVWTGAGNYVSTANPGGETFVYMHLDSFADIDEGDTLEPGDVIGYVGNTGNASGGAPHLHLEIRKSAGPTDPFPRLTKEFSLEDKMDFAQNVLNDAGDEEKMAAFLVANYRAQFLAARALKIDLPEDIEKALGGASPAGTSATSGSAPIANVVPSRDLKLGSSGTDVIWLQAFLIVASSGSAAVALAKAGPTGYFGPITKAALAEYQAKSGISPAAGYFGPLTRARVTATLNN